MSELLCNSRAGLLIAFLLLSHSLSAEPFDLPVHNPVPGGVAVLPLGPSNVPRPTVHFGERPVLVASRDSTWSALVGLSQDTIPGQYLISISQPDAPSELRYFTVSPLPASRRQRMIVLPKPIRDVDLAVQLPDQVPPAGLPVSNLESYTDLAFSHATTARIIVPYGRVVKESRGGIVINHPGITYFTDTGSFVNAPGSGIVVQVIDSENNNNSLVLAHAQGFYSVLVNLDRVLVLPGDVVESGSRVGTASRLPLSEFGRVDWYLILNGASIDPSPLLSFVPPPSRPLP